MTSRITLVRKVQESSRRAQPLAVEDRQAIIIDAVTPLLIANGRSVTSKQMANAAGVAEGTIFRAFGDKESLVAAVIAHHLDQTSFQKALRGIDSTLSLDAKKRAVVVLMRERFGRVFQVMAAIGHSEHPAVPHDRTEFVDVITHLLEPELAALNFSPERVAHIVRLIAFASSFPQLTSGIEFNDDELAAIVLYGVAGSGAPHPRLD